MNIRHTPGTVAAPFGPYSHAVEVPEGSRFLYISGEVGVLPSSPMAPCLTASRPRPRRAGRTLSPSLRTPGWKLRRGGPFLDGYRLSSLYSCYPTSDGPIRVRC
jgi:hypothetical protein